jgi:hypothetical protein
MRFPRTAGLRFFHFRGLDSRDPVRQGCRTLNKAIHTMKKFLLAAASALTALVLPGCFQSETTIHLNKDGSGTLVEETKLGAQMLAMMDQMAAGFGGGGENAKEDPVKKMFSEDKAKKRAAELGEGVTFEKSEAANANGAKGARVTYKFKDINKLKVSSDDGMKNASPMGDMPGAPAAKKSDPVVFTYADGKLTIKMPDQKKPDAPDAPEAPAAEGPGKPDMDSPEAQAMMKQMFADMKVSLKLVVEPGIAETNATHKDGDTITLMEMNMGKLMENADTFKKLGKVNQQDPTAAMEVLKGIEGVKVETKKEVTVELK